MNVREFLMQNNVAFEMMEHRPTYSAQTLAQAVHVSGERVAKTVLLRADDKHVLAVLPATHTIDMQRVQSVLNAQQLDLATESECGVQFSDCEIGALPPFGSRYGMRTLIDKSLLEDGDVVFEANTHEQAIRMGTEDFVRLEQPLVAEFADHV